MSETVYWMTEGWRGEVVLQQAQIARESAKQVTLAGSVDFRKQFPASDPRVQSRSPEAAYLAYIERTHAEEERLRIELNAIAVRRVQARELIGPVRGQ